MFLCSQLPDILQTLRNLQSNASLRIYVYTYIKKVAQRMYDFIYPFYSVGIESIVNTGTVECCKVNTFPSRTPRGLFIGLIYLCLSILGPNKADSWRSFAPGVCVLPQLACVPSHRGGYYIRRHIRYYILIYIVPSPLHCIVHHCG